MHLGLVLTIGSNKTQHVKATAGSSSFEMKASTKSRAPKRVVPSSRATRNNKKDVRCRKRYPMCSAKPGTVSCIKQTSTQPVQ